MVILEKKVKVCFVTVEYPPDMGGVSKSAKRIVDFLSIAGFDVHIFAPCQKGEKDAEYYKTATDGITIIRVNCKSKTKEEAFVDVLCQFDKKEKYDIFHGFFLFMAYPCIQIANNRPVIASFRGIDAEQMTMERYSHISKEVLRKSSWITSVSSDSLKRANDIEDISARSSFIFNSIRNNVNEKWTLNNGNEFVVGTVSTFRPKKNIPLLVDAYSMVKDDYRKRLLLVGDFIQNKRLDPLRKQNFLLFSRFLGVEDEVCVTGYINNEDVTRYLMQMNTFVLSSKNEGLPNALMEALAVGLPVVSTAVDGVKDICEHEKNALLVASDNAEEMSMAIEEILRKKSLAEKLSKGALDLAASLNERAEMKLWIELYKKLL